MRTAGRYLFRFAACLLLMTLCAMLATEACLRVFTRPPFSVGYLRTHPTRHFELVPGFHGRTYDLDLDINSRGMRDQERAVDPAAFRIAVFGDSFTFGQGVDLSQLYTSRLEQRLSTQQRAIQVFNVAVPGLNTVAEWSLLRDTYETLKPDLVVFQYTVADDSVPMTESATNRFLAVRVAKDVLRHFYAYDYLAARFYGLRNSKQKTVHPDDGAIARNVALLYSEGNPGWAELKTAFHELAAFASEKHFAVVFALICYQTHIGANADADLIHASAEKVMGALDAEHLDHHLFIDDAIRGYAGREAQLMVRPDDHHFNVAGHELIAAHLAQYLEDQHLVAVEPSSAHRD